jgi:hypothetical protein
VSKYDSNFAPHLAALKAKTVAGTGNIHGARDDDLDMSIASMGTATTTATATATATTTATMTSSAVYPLPPSSSSQLYDRDGDHDHDDDHVTGSSNPQSVLLPEGSAFQDTYEFSDFRDLHTQNLPGLHDQLHEVISDPSRDLPDSLEQFFGSPRVLVQLQRKYTEKVNVLRPEQGEHVREEKIFSPCRMNIDPDMQMSALRGNQKLFEIANLSYGATRQQATWENVDVSSFLEFFSVTSLTEITAGWKSKIRESDFVRIHIRPDLPPKRALHVEVNCPKSVTKADIWTILALTRVLGQYRGRSLAQNHPWVTGFSFHY